SSGGPLRPKRQRQKPCSSGWLRAYYNLREFRSGAIVAKPAECGFEFLNLRIGLAGAIPQVIISHKIIPLGLGQLLLGQRPVAPLPFPRSRPAMRLFLPAGKLLPQVL